MCVPVFALYCKFRFIEQFQTAYSVGEGLDPPLLGAN